jgi:penicillin-binding protein 1A
VKVLSEGVTAEETKILEQNVQSGTATRSAINCPTAAKTGTTSELADAWLDGYTPNYSTVVWMGYPNKRVSMTSVHGQPQQGGYLPAEIWHAYMSAVVGGHCVPFPQAAQPLSYQPFFGKFATTGKSSEASQSSGEKPSESVGGRNHLHRSVHPGSGAGGGAGSHGGGESDRENGGGSSPSKESGPPARAPAPHRPSAPAPRAPGVNGTGGAAPG